MNYRSAAFGCPRCSATLRATRVDAFDLLACASCGGVFADNAASQAIAARAERELVAFDASWSMGKPAARTEHVTMSCPMCTAPLESILVDRANMWIDVCREHGTWFDVGEMQSVAKALKTSRQVAGRISRTATYEYPPPDVHSDRAANVAESLESSVSLIAKLFS